MGMFKRRLVLLLFLSLVSSGLLLNLLYASDIDDIPDADSYGSQYFGYPKSSSTQISRCIGKGIIFCCSLAILSLWTISTFMHRNVNQLLPQAGYTRFDHHDVTVVQPLSLEQFDADPLFWLNGTN